MQQPKEPFIINRLKAFKYAFKGAFYLLRTEASIKVQVFCALVVCILGFYFEITTIEWCIQLLAIALVLAVEGLNSAIEKIADFVHPDYHKKIGIIKDVSAGAVTFAAVIAGIIGLLIYIPYLF
ncbi:MULTISPECIES: diacylglycerol kinase [unclassified Leeuwenhoekiella]|uniref:diacylglycerol kinase n=1 Tax=unclassified Leeuwenhoekiella TaxID=2615029 RepID=UPI000C386B14|nr:MULTISPECIES: diacylglycerol kinase family protein [unclassified Leeuwenhoekiella]MAW95617.1 diacylglycerol kinase [Leeuwenhoekiella sp.]MBA82291.1 diacylglycerol kinase [Leeuwenhoekiella sp.]|tara:strand:- start:8035 stop:8406 length:372 start_codon:yes stop_codon:yes gene_type:complete